VPRPARLCARRTQFANAASASSDSPSVRAGIQVCAVDDPSGSVSKRLKEVESPIAKRLSATSLPMDFTIEFGGDPQDVTITLSGVASPEGFLRFNDARLSDQRFREGLLILLDASALDTSQMTESMFQAAVEPMIERERLYPPLGLAILAPDEQTFKDAILTRAHLGGSSSRRGVFGSREAALTWLCEQRPAAQGVDVTPLHGVPAVPDELRALARHDRVRVPDGRIGEVVGFYREEDEPILVLFKSGDTKRYRRADLRLIS
jgi:hypothetical protein